MLGRCRCGRRARATRAREAAARPHCGALRFAAAPPPRLGRCEAAVRLRCCAGLRVGLKGAVGSIRPRCLKHRSARCLQRATARWRLARRGLSRQAESEERSACRGRSSRLGLSGRCCPDQQHLRQNEISGRESRLGLSGRCCPDQQDQQLSRKRTKNCQRLQKRVERVNAALRTVKNAKVRHHTANRKSGQQPVPVSRRGDRRRWRPRPRPRRTRPRAGPCSGRAGRYRTSRARAPRTARGSRR